MRGIGSRCLFTPTVSYPSLSDTELKTHFLGYSSSFFLYTYFMPNAEHMACSTALALTCVFIYTCAIKDTAFLKKRSLLLFLSRLASLTCSVVSFSAHCIKDENPTNSYAGVLLRATTTFIASKIGGTLTAFATISKLDKVHKNRSPESNFRTSSSFISGYLSLKYTAASLILSSSVMATFTNLNPPSTMVSTTSCILTFGSIRES